MVGNPWILATENLPKHGESVLVQVISGDDKYLLVATLDAGYGWDIPHADIFLAPGLWSVYQWTRIPEPPPF